MASKTLWVLAILLCSLYSAHSWSYIGCFTREQLDVQEEGSGKDSTACVDYCYEKYGNPIGVMVSTSGYNGFITACLLFLICLVPADWRHKVRVHRANPTPGRAGGGREVRWQHHGRHIC